jgi:hypothetical protein
LNPDRNWTKQLPRTIEAGRAFKAKYDAEYGKDEPVPFDALSQLPFEAFNMMEDVELLGADAPDALHLL